MDGHTGLPWVGNEIVYPAGSYVYTQASWILPELRDRGAALLRSAGQWAAENGMWALTEMAKGVSNQVNRAYKRLALPAPEDKSAKSPLEQKIPPGAMPLPQ